MEDILKKQEGENNFDYISRLVIGKLIDKTIDNDYTELAPLIFGQELSSSECRKRLYGIKRLLEIQDKDKLNEKSNEIKKDTTVLKHEYDNYEQFKTYKEVTEINKDGSYSSDKLIGIEDESKLKDEDFLLTVHSYDPKVWQIVSARNSIWNTQLKGGKVTKLYASKINVKPRIDSISIEEIREDFKKFAEEYKPNNKKIYTNALSENNNKILELPIVDLHYGKKSFEFETGENMDSETCEKNVLTVVEDILKRTKGTNFDKIIFPIGNDMFNSDTIANTTTKGTRQDNDCRWQELFLKGCQLLIKAIDKLSYVAPVEVFYIAGNHDKMVSYYATNYLYAWYRNDARVNVDINPQIRKYIEYGNCLIGFSHGNEEGKRINSIMQIEASQAWGRTKFREFHTCHIHHEVVKEENGIIVRSLSTLTGTDAWHYESGYVGNIKKQQVFIWDKEYGLIDILHSVII
jgi:hypothetical protein